MAINNRLDLNAEFAARGYVIIDYIFTGANRLVPTGTYLRDDDSAPYASVTFEGTSGKDTLIGGGGALFTFFLGSAGNDLYGIDGSDSFLGYVDYSAAAKGVVVDMSYRGTRTFTDETGATRTETVIGKARDGFGGTDYFFGLEGRGTSAIVGVFGSSHRDVMIAGGGGDEFFGGGGDDLLIGGYGNGEAGNDRLVGRATENFQYSAGSDEGNDCLIGTEFGDFRFTGGTGNDQIRAGGGNDRFVVGEAGNDTVDGGTGDDFIDGGVGSDLLISGAGNDTINPDIEFFQSTFTNPDRVTDAARDIIRVTRDDLGDFNDVILAGAFETGQDVIRFRDAVASGKDYRLSVEDQSFNVVTGRLFLSDDRANMANTVLQIDQDDDGFGTTDYFLYIVDATPTEQPGFLLT